MRKFSATLILAGIVGLSGIAWWGGCGGNKKPRYGSVVSATVSTAELPSNGGMVTIEAEVSYTNTSAVYASLTLTGAPPREVDLTNTTGTHYRGTVHLPANPGLGDQVYRVELYARNLLNELLGPVSAGTIRVRGAGTGTTDNQPPMVTQATVAPASLPVEGGGITVSAQVGDADEAPVESVFAEIAQGDGTFWRWTLERISGDAQEGAYRGSFDLPGNPTATAQTYTVAVSAQDTVQAVATPVSAGAVIVAGLNVPPDPPAD